MIKKLLPLIILFVATMLSAQEVERILVKGTIHVPTGEDAEGIGVYNISSQRGTVTAINGTFEIAVAKNDRLQIFALQYQSFTVVVDEGIIVKKEMNIYVNPSVTQLDEVVVRPSDLSGNIRADIKRIPTFTVDKNWDLSYRGMEFGYGFTVDEQTAIRGNAAEEALNLHRLQHGINFVAMFGGVANLLFPKNQKINTKSHLQKEDKRSNNLRNRFSRKFVEDNFNIPEDQAYEFLFYAQEKGLTDNMLRPENELVLMDFLHKSSKEFKKLKE